jgi:hypothetical protein
MVSGMQEWLILVAHLIVTIVKIATPGGARAVVAESLILNQQPLILESRKRAPKLGAVDRVLLGLGAKSRAESSLPHAATILSPLAKGCWLGSVLSGHVGVCGSVPRQTHHSSNSPRISDPRFKQTSGSRSAETLGRD